MIGYRLTRLPCGVRVATAEMEGTCTVSLGLWIGVGSRHEPAALSGASHFLEHVLFKGTRRRSARMIAVAVEEVGGHLNAFTGEDHTCLHAQARARHLPRLVDVLLDMFLEPRVAPADVERERRVIRDEIAMVQDNPAQRAEELLAQTLWPGHPLGRPITGDAASVGRISSAHLRAHHRRHYGGANTVVAAAGRCRHEDLLALLAPRLRALPTGRLPRARPWRPDRRAPRIRIDPRPTEQAHLSLGFPTFGRRDPRRTALRLLSVVLGESLTSRLFQQLRERRAYCYSIGSSTDFLADTGALYIDAALDPSHLEPAARAIRCEIVRLGEHAIGLRELRRAREYVLGQMEMSLEQPVSHMHWIGESVLGQGRIVAPSEIESALRQTGAEAIRTLARTHVAPRRTRVALVTPPAGTPPASAVLSWLR